ncbi:unnamed protein product [Effrenium voratum]|nr:unnamed protein product [Effrenium voratum]
MGEGQPMVAHLHCCCAAGNDRFSSADLLYRPRYFAPPETAHAIAGELENEVARTLALPDDCVADGMMPPVLSDLRQTQGYRFCHTCEVIRPPRTSHCNDCGNCVLTFDHHCPFVNNCIGQRNYVFFSAFLISTGCLGVSVAVGVGIRCTHHDAAWKRSSPWIVGFLVLIGLATAVLLVGVVGLTIFHLFLLCTGKTTKEVCTGRMARHGRSLFARPPSLIHAREHVDVPLPENNAF